MAEYKENNADNFLIPKGLSDKGIAKLKGGKSYVSAINKINIIQLVDNFPAKDVGYIDERFKPKTAYDLCVASKEMGAVQYDIDDFKYCKWFGAPINRLITLRRFPYPCTDNIFDTFNQAEPDIARLVTYSNNDTNKLEDILSFSYKMKWKSLDAEMSHADMQGDQSGFDGMIGSVQKYIDPVSAQNKLRGKNAINYDPKVDSNKVWGPVDSLAQTHIRDIGLEFDKKFELVFDYEAKSYDGKTPEYVMRDIISNILTCTFNDAKFWPGARYWVGERPSSLWKHFKGLRDPKSIDEFFSKGYTDLKSAVGDWLKKGSAIKALQNAMKAGLAYSIGSLLDTIGRPSIPAMASLLSGEPVGYWHVMIGNPYNPIMCIGNLIIDDVQIKFPTETMSYGDFPNKVQVIISLKNAMPKDRAGAEMMFNKGKQRIYYQPKKVVNEKNLNAVKSPYRKMVHDKSAIGAMIDETLNFVAKGSVEIVSNSYEIGKNTVKTGLKSVNVNDINVNPKQVASDLTLKLKRLNESSML